MDNLPLMAGIPRKELIGGIEYTISPTSVWDYGRIEQHLLTTRRNPVDVVKEHIVGSNVPDSIQSEMLREAVAQETYQIMPEGIIGRFLMTRTGLLHLFWMMLQVHHPEVDTLDKARKIAMHFVGNNLKRLADYVDQMNGFTQLKNSQAPGEPAPEKE